MARGPRVCMPHWHPLIHHHAVSWMSAKFWHLLLQVRRWSVWKQPPVLLHLQDSQQISSSLLGRWYRKNVDGCDKKLWKNLAWVISMNGFSYGQITWSKSCLKDQCQNKERLLMAYWSLNLPYSTVINWRRTYSIFIKFATSKKQGLITNMLDVRIKN